ncbi:unnamed protein product [Strongylus vulgaris]|uniref:Uncharacterized protein n=1 Tax=Strongylus vulgaris TaxID=40348 RepID=A0A3P7J8F1_STRVU|nr:unnamed protein product [Strongylus vulgaris]
MRLSLSTSIPPGIVEIGRNDAYNMFGGEPGSDFVVDISCDESPCILDATSSFYQISSVTTHLPYAAQPQLFELPPQMRAVVVKMRNVILAHDVVSKFVR